MQDILKGDGAYFEALSKGRRKLLDRRTFQQPIRSMGRRAGIAKDAEGA